MSTQDDQTIEILGNTLLLAEAGKEEHARTYLQDQFPRLPEDLQDAIAIEAFVSAVNDEARRVEIIQQMQEEGLAAASVLEEEKERIEKEGNGNT